MLKFFYIVAKPGKIYPNQNEPTLHFKQGCPILTQTRRDQPPTTETRQIDFDPNLNWPNRHWRDSSGDLYLKRIEIPQTWIKPDLTHIHMNQTEYITYLK